MKFATFALAATAMTAAVVPLSAANAALLLFELSGGRNVTFTLDSDPTPDSSQSFSGEQAVFRNLPGTINGSPGTLTTVSFGTGVFADLSITAPGLGFTQFSTGGPIFSGPGSAPVFAPGTFQMRNAFFPEQNSTLVISAAVAPVPEPATWAMLILGFGMVGAGLRSATRKRQSAALHFA